MLTERNTVEVLQTDRVKSQMKIGNAMPEVKVFLLIKLHCEVQIFLVHILLAILFLVYLPHHIHEYIHQEDFVSTPV